MKTIRSTATALATLSALSAGATFAAAPAQAAIGTTPDTRPAAPQQRKSWKTFGMGAELGGNWLLGNVDFFNLSANLNFNANMGPHQFFLDAGNTLTRFSGVTAVNRVSGSGLYAYALLDDFNLYGYTTSAHDQSTRTDYRLTNGLGLCLHKIAAPTFSLFLVSLGPSLEQEWIGGSTSPQNIVRSVARLNAILPITDTLDWAVDAFYTPAVTNFADYRVYAESYVQVKLAPALWLKITAADEFDSAPAGPAIKNNDMGFFVGLKSEFGN